MIHEDNTSAIALATKGQASSDTMKHVKVRTYLIKQHLDSGDVMIQHCPTEDMLADLLTKPLQGKQFWKLLSAITGQARSKEGAC
jgi:ABC-type nitrate/sulfonate/bicarbonate transport system substrate-binding protein